LDITIRRVVRAGETLFLNLAIVVVLAHVLA
jgi:hypothetical protein